MKRWLPGLALLAASSVPCAEELPGFFQVHLENDKFGTNNHDRWYTNGTRFTWALKNESPNPFDARIRRVILGADWSDDGIATSATPYATFFGQSMYTPQDIKKAEPQPDDRPWAGWLYLGRAYQGVAVRKRWGDWRLVHRIAEVSVGVVGPSAAARQAQTFIHRHIVITDLPQGWSNQIHDEPTINVRFQETTKYGDEGKDALLHWGYNAGNVQLYGNIGAMLRIGHNLCDFGVSKQAPSYTGPGVRAQAPIRLAYNGDADPQPAKLPCSDPHAAARESWGLSGGFDLRAVARSIFLDGNTFRDSPHVKRKPIVNDGIVALTYRHAAPRAWSASWLLINRSAEFTGPKAQRQQYGAIVFSWPL